MAKVCRSFQTGERNFYEIVIFFTPIYGSMHPYALKKAHFLKSHFLHPIQKKILQFHFNGKNLVFKKNILILTFLEVLTLSIPSNTSPDDGQDPN